MSEIQFDELPMEPDAIKAAIRVRREAVAIMLREVSILSENLRKKIGPVAMIQWMATQANAVDEVLKTNTEFVNKGKPEGGDDE